MKGIILITLCLAFTTYVYFKINEKQKQNIVKERVQSLKTLNNYEFNSSLHKVRAARARLHRTLKPAIIEKKEEQEEIQNDKEIEVNDEIEGKDIEEIEQDVQEAEELKKEEVVPATSLRGLKHIRANEE